MNHDETLKYEMSRFMELQRIKKANGDHSNIELDNALKESRALLQLLGANTEELNIL